MNDYTTPEFEAMKKQKATILRRQREAKDIQIDRLKRLLRIALADLTGVRAGRLTPEQLRIFLSDCAAALGADDGKASNPERSGPTADAASKPDVAGSADAKLLGADHLPEKQS